MASLLFLFFTTSLVAIFLYLCLTTFNILLFSKKNRNKRVSRSVDDLPLPPGPRGWPIIGNLFQLGPKPHHTFQAMSKVYGPILHLRLGTVDVVVATSAYVASLFLKTNDANFVNRPPNTGAKHMAYGYQDLVWAPYGPRWRALRRICTLHLFSPKALDDFRHVREEEVAALVGTLAEAGRGRDLQPVHVGDWLTTSMANALTRAMLGRKMFSVDNDMAREFKGMSTELTKLAGVFLIGDYLPALRWWDWMGVVGKMKTVANKLDVFMGKLLEEHLRGDHNNKDMMSVLIGLKDQATGDGIKLTDLEIKALLVDLFTAGTDTSSSTTEWALAELIRHPELLRKAQDELDYVVGQDRLVSETDLPNLPLMQAIVKETFRLHPSTPLSLPHVASDDCEVMGYRVPKNATLLVDVWAIGRDPREWTDPLEFRPERFLPGGDKAHVDVRGNSFEVIPFGAGRRICAGMSWGLRMVQVMVANLVHAFHLDLPAGVRPEQLCMEELFGLTLQREEPLLVHPRPRLPSHAYGSLC